MRNRCPSSPIRPSWPYPTKTERKAPILAAQDMVALMLQSQKSLNAARDFLRGSETELWITTRRKHSTVRELLARWVSEYERDLIVMQSKMVQLLEQAQMLLALEQGGR